MGEGDGTRAAPGRSPDRDHLAGVSLMLGAVLLFAGIDASAKLGGRYVPKVELVWFRFAVQAVLVAVVLNPWRSPTSWRTRRPLLQVARAAVQVVCTGLNFLALGYLQLAEALSIQFLTPVFVAVLSMLFLGETVGPRRWAEIAAGFAGVLVVTRPGIAGMHWAFGLSLASVAIGANYNLLTRELAMTETPGSMLLVTALVPTVLLAPVLPFVWVWPRGWEPCAALLGVGAFGAAGHGLMILAHRRAPASTLAPFQYFQLLATVGLGYALFSDIPSRWTLVGAAIVVASGLSMMFGHPSSDRAGRSGHRSSARQAR